MTDDTVLGLVLGGAVFLMVWAIDASRKKKRQGGDYDGGLSTDWDSDSSDSSDSSSDGGGGDGGGGDGGGE